MNILSLSSATMWAFVLLPATACSAYPEPVLCHQVGLCATACYCLLRIP